MKKTKRIIAGGGAILLIVLYIATVILAFIDHPAAHNFFIGSLVCTGVVPVLLYVYMLIYKLASKNDE